MKRWLHVGWVAAVAMLLIWWQPMGSLAAEHKGFPWFGGKKERAGKEHGGQPVATQEEQERSGQEHAGQTQPGATQEHGGTAVKEHGGTTETTALQQPPGPPAPEEIRSTIEHHVMDIVATEGTFSIEDEQSGQTRQLEFVRVHERVGKTGDYYYSCTDMRDLDSGELLDLDFDVEQEPDGSLEIVDVRIHKVDGQPRYTYDENDQIIPLTPR